MSRPALVSGSPARLCALSGEVLGQIATPHGWHATLCVVREKPRLHTASHWRQRLSILPDSSRQAVSCSPLEGDCRPPRRQTLHRARKGPVFLFVQLSRGFTFRHAAHSSIFRNLGVFSGLGILEYFSGPRSAAERCELRMRDAGPPLAACGSWVPPRSFAPPAIPGQSPECLPHECLPHERLRASPV